MKNIKTITKKINLPKKSIIAYGDYKAKIDMSFLSDSNMNGKLVLVTAMTPTKFGEGKTTMSIGLADGLNYIGQNAILSLREPSLGPVFGLKGGATGGGKSQVIPSEDINLHFNGDMHALTSSINLISAVIDNEIYRGNKLNIDPNRVLWKRAIDINDRALRDIIVSNNPSDGISRKDGFIITVASELMAIMCLANDELDFLDKISRILVAYTYDNKPILLKDLKITHAVMKLMKEALKPNLVQTLEGNPAIIHGGPFANIAHGCSSIIATKLGLKISPIVITEAGFGADLGAEKFFDIKCRVGNLNPQLVVFVITLRAILEHGGFKENSKVSKKEAVITGFSNVKRHIENLKKFNVPILIVLNSFPDDKNKTNKEALEELNKQIKVLLENDKKIDFSVSNSYLLGGKGAADFARKALSMLNNNQSKYQPLYELNTPVTGKITKIASEIYRAEKVEFSERALKQISDINKEGYSDFSICVAKTPLSFSDDPLLVNAPTGFTLHVDNITVNTGSKFIIVETGKILRMPGLPLIPAAVKMEDEKY